MDELSEIELGFDMIGVLVGGLDSPIKALSDWHGRETKKSRVFPS
jgi:hypothetical protein